MSSSNGCIVREAVTVLRQEIARFIEAANRHEENGQERRRTKRRGEDDWPLLILLGDRTYDPDLAVRLHDVSDLGLAFYSRTSIPDRAVLFIKLFAREDFCPRVPAVVRHVTPGNGGYLIGCEYQLADPDLCDRAMEIGRRSRPRRILT